MNDKQDASPSDDMPDDDKPWWHDHSKVWSVLSALPNTDTSGVAWAGFWIGLSIFISTLFVIANWPLS